ncbi:MAG: winged helix-turn-helix domain-containing protein [Pseudomonadota bacterium]
MRYAFGEFVLDLERVELRRTGAVVAMEPKAYDLLAYLVSNRDRVVSKDDILDRVWSGLFVSDASISTAIKQVRRTLGDDGGKQCFVKTVWGKGFRFVAPVHEPSACPTTHAACRDPRPEGSDPKPGAAPVLAVLPFTLLHSEGVHSAIAEAIPIELIAALSRSRGVRVIARGSSFRFDTARHDLGEIRTRLGAGYVVSGSVDLTANRLVMAMELADTSNHAIVWSEVFDGPLDDLFAIRQRAVREVCSAIELRLPFHEAEALSRVPTEALDAWGHYHLGLRHLYRINAADIESARFHMQKAIELDPGFARAHAGLSFAESEIYNLFYGTDRSESLARTVEEAERGCSLDPSDPFCALILGRARWYAEDLDGAMAWTDRAVTLDPNHAFARYNSGKLSAIACRGDEAEDLAATAMTLSPLDPHMQSMLSARGLAGFVADDEGRATGHAAASLTAPNPHLYVRLFAGAILNHYGREAEAQRAVESINKDYSGFSKDHFRSLFTLRDAERNRALLDALSELGV